MSRLIDADLLLENAIKYNIGRTSFEEMIKFVNEQPTAYDLEAVVQQLEVLHDLVNTNQKLAVLQAIEIVRNGGVK